MAGKRLAVTFGPLYEEVEQRARKREMSMADFVREAVHDHIHSDRLPRRDDLAWIKFLLARHYENQVRVGNNLNQLVLRFHEIGVIDPEHLDSLFKEIMKEFNAYCSMQDELENRFGEL